MAWKCIDTGVHSAQKNMDLDANLLETLQDDPILHFYDWNGNSATYGFFVDPADYLNLEEVKKRRLHLGKRPTGGGIVFHIWDLAFSVLLPSSHPDFSKNTLENYAFVNNAVLAAVSTFVKDLTLIPQDAKALDTSCMRFCMAQPTKYDVVHDGKKIAGAAQRRTKKGFLHQGTISLQMPSFEYLEAVLLPETKVLEAIREHTQPLLASDDDLEEGRRALKEELKKQLIRENYVQS